MAQHDWDGYDAEPRGDARRIPLSREDADRLNAAVLRATASDLDQRAAHQDERADRLESALDCRVNQRRDWLLGLTGAALVPVAISVFAHAGTVGPRWGFGVLVTLLIVAFGVAGKWLAFAARTRSEMAGVIFQGAALGVAVAVILLGVGTERHFPVSSHPVAAAFAMLVGVLLAALPIHLLIAAIRTAANVARADSAHLCETATSLRAQLPQEE